jgi:site-specific DNA-methyltransferase (adenine-specific)
MTTIYYDLTDIHKKICDFDADSIDMIYTDPPFGSTNASWDKALDWKILFSEMWRCLKPNGVIILYCSMPFTYELLQYEKPKYHYTWIKSNSTNFFHAKKQPLRNTEEILVYYKKQPKYNPQMDGEQIIKKSFRKLKDKQNYYGRRENITKDYISDTESHTGHYPTTAKYWKIRRDSSGITRDDTQIDYFIKTYTDEKDTILDMTCCNKYVGNRCKELKRNYIGVDLRKIV